MALVACVGCQYFDRARECRALADSVNPEIKELARIYGQRSPSSSAQYREVAKKYGDAAKRLKGLKLKDTELSRHSKDLTENLAALSRSCDRFAAAAPGSSKVGPDAGGKREFESLAHLHRVTINAIDRRCVE
jgi:hypothetical protein